MIALNIKETNLDQKSFDCKDISVGSRTYLAQESSLNVLSSCFQVKSGCQERCHKKWCFH